MSRVINILKPGGNFVYHFKLSTIYILPTQCICVFYVILTTQTIVSLYSVNELVFVMGTEFVLCEVGPSFYGLSRKIFILVHSLMLLLCGLPLRICQRRQTLRLCATNSTITLLMYVIYTRYNKKAIILLIYSMRRITHTHTHTHTHTYTHTHTHNMKVEFELCSKLLTFDKYVDESDT
jgi:hypothetical protein